MLAVTDLLEQVASIVEPAVGSFGLNDPDEEIYLATALSGQAEALTGGLAGPQGAPGSIAYQRFAK